MNGKAYNYVLVYIYYNVTYIIFRVVCSPRTIHLVVWDGSSLGLQLADRLIIRGAKKLRLVCLNASSQHLLKLR